MSAIEFVDVTQEAGINYNQISFGSSWVDINNDGWPDLWLGNHANQPQLYINNTDGTFTDQLATFIPGFTTSRDMHGAAFADYDNDGNQDLLIFWNQQSIKVSPGTWQNAALVWLEQWWLLDVLIANTPRPDGQAPAALFTQVQGEFTETSAQTGITSKSDNSFAQLFSIGNQYTPSLILNGSPFPDSLYTYDTTPFNNKKNNYATTFANMWNVRDVVIADLDGNQLPDIFAVREKYGSDKTAELLQPESNKITASLIVNGGEKSFSFKSDGNIKFQISPYWRKFPYKCHPD